MKFVSVNRRRIILARPNVRYTSPNDFRKAILSLKSLVRDSGVKMTFVMPILETTEFHEARSPGYNAAVKAYNSAFAEASDQLGWRCLRQSDLCQSVPIKDLLLDDGQHLSRLGHKVVASFVSGVISASVRWPLT